MTQRRVKENPFRRTDRGTRGWIHNYARRYHKSVASFIDLDDLIQDGYMCYYRCVAEYPGVKDRPHIMALFKRFFHNHLYRLRQQHARVPTITVTDLAFDADTAERIWEDLVGTTEEFGTIEGVVARAPEELGQLLMLFLTDAGAARLRRAYRWRYGLRETTNEFLCRLIAANPNEHQLRTELHQFLHAGA